MAPHSKTDHKTQVDDEKQELEMSPQCKQYYLEVVEIKKEMDRLLTTTDSFKMSLQTYFDFEIQDKSFKIRQMVSHSSDTKQKKNPMIWYTETICPGSPKMVHESLMDPTYRMQWETHLSSFQIIQIDDAFQMFILYIHLLNLPLED